MLSLAACSPQEVPPRATPAKAVVVLKAHATTLYDQIEAMGSLKANESIDFAAQVSGKLEKVLFQDGQTVHKGDLIALLDDDEDQAQLMAEQAQLAEHLREIQRLELLLTRHAVPERTLDERKTLAALTRSHIRQIQARIGEKRLKAPFDGQMGIRQVSPGMLMQPGQVIATLDDVRSMKIDFTIPSTLLPTVHVESDIQVRSALFPRRIFKGKVASIDSRIDPMTRAILLRATLDNADGVLIPGMLMAVTLLQHERQALMVPEEAVTQKQEKHFLTLVNHEDKAEIRAVTTGIRRDGFVEITQGLKAGERLVVRGMGFVKSGKAVKVEETWERMKDAQFPRQGA